MKHIKTKAKVTASHNIQEQKIGYGPFACSARHALLSGTCRASASEMVHQRSTPRSMRVSSSSHRGLDIQVMQHCRRLSGAAAWAVRAPPLAASQRQKRERARAHSIYRVPGAPHRRALVA